MGNELQKYHPNSPNIIAQSARALANYADQTRTSIEGAYYTANVRGRFFQMEADMILEHELGLPPRRKKKDQSW